MDLGAGISGAVELGDGVFEVFKGFAADEVLPVVGEIEVCSGPQFLGVWLGKLSLSSWEWESLLGRGGMMESESSG